MNEPYILFVLALYLCFFLCVLRFYLDDVCSVRFFDPLDVLKKVIFSVDKCKIKIVILIIVISIIVILIIVILIIVILIIVILIIVILIIAILIIGMFFQS